MLGPQEMGFLIGCCWLQFVKQLRTKKKQEEIRQSDGEYQTYPKELDTPNQQEVV